MRFSASARLNIILMALIRGTAGDDKKEERIFDWDARTARGEREREREGGKGGSRNPSLLIKVSPRNRKQISLLAQLQLKTSLRICLPADRMHYAA